MPLYNIKTQLHQTLRALTEWSTAKAKHLSEHSGKPPKDIRVKLIAVAKDEAAYIAEWIAHHLYFGFDEIEIHINRTTDNTREIVKCFESQGNIKLVEADPFFDSYPGNPQVGTYKKAFASAAKEGFSHLCFLDIDEYWVPTNLTDTIKDAIANLAPADVISFEWFNKFEPDNVFGPALESSVFAIRATQVKSVVDAKAPSFRVNPHSIVNPYLRYKLADGRTFEQCSEGFSRVKPEELTKAVKPYFILHRYYRSQKEYIALLGKGRPNFPQQGVSQVKSNRKGYADRSKVTEVRFNKEAYNSYRTKIEKTVRQYVDTSLLSLAQKSVTQRYARVLEIIEKSEASQAGVLNKVLLNVTDKEALNAYQKFQSSLHR